MEKFVIAGLVVTLLAGTAASIAQDAAKKSESKKEPSGVVLKINITSVPVSDQEKALKFYTEVLGFVKKKDVPAGGGRWLTVVSPGSSGEVELLLEPIGFPPAKTFQKALFDAGIPWTSFGVDDIQKTYERMQKLGVVFKTKPTKAGPVMTAVFEDTCGNLIVIVQEG